MSKVSVHSSSRSFSLRTLIGPWLTSDFFWRHSGKADNRHVYLKQTNCLLVYFCKTRAKTVSLYFWLPWKQYLSPLFPLTPSTQPFIFLFSPLHNLTHTADFQNFARPKPKVIVTCRCHFSKGFFSLMSRRDLQQLCKIATRITLSFTMLDIDSWGGGFWLWYFFAMDWRIFMWFCANLGKCLDRRFFLLMLTI